MRSSDDRVDVSAIARLSGGGGHRQAAGFSSDLSIAEITDLIVSAYAELPAVPA
jgi:phosphoesterase RecJ-like protein